MESVDTGVISVPLQASTLDANIHICRVKSGILFIYLFVG